MKGQKGITLIALIITIIVMLILVGVSITVVIQSGLLDTAKDAGNQTETKYSEEASMNSWVNVGGTMVDISTYDD